MTRGDQGLHRYIVISCPTSCKSTPRSSGFPTRYCFSVHSQKEGRRKFRRGQSAWPENQKSRSDQKSGKKNKQILPKLRLLSNEWYCTSVLSELGDVLKKKKKKKNCRQKCETFRNVWPVIFTVVIVCNEDALTWPETRLMTKTSN